MTGFTKGIEETWQHVYYRASQDTKETQRL